MHSADSNTLIRINNVWLIRQQKTILRDVSLNVDKGDFVVITGPNGGGKTSLLRIILGLLSPTRGSVEISRGLTIGYLPQKNHIDSHFPISVREVVESGLLGIKGISRDQRKAKTEEMLELIGLSSHASNAIGQLSGGQLQRTLLARAIISRPELLVLDEPLSYLDKKFEHKLYELIESISSHSTILLVSHELTNIGGMASKHLVVDKGIL